MSRTVNCLLMLLYLKSGRKAKISELVDFIEFNTGDEVNPRNIIEYRKELESAGYLIETIPGKYGGYQLKNGTIFPVLKFTEEEKKALLEAYQYVNSKQDFMSKEKLDIAIGKIFSSIENKNEYIDLISVEQYQLTMSDPQIKERYEFVNKAIREKKQIEILYGSLKSGKKTHVLHPYKLFLYNNSWFFFAFNPEEGAVWSFKVNRILEYKQLDKRFSVMRGFDPKDYIDEHGFKNNGNWHHLELVATGTRAMLLRERVYGRNQVVTELEDGSIKVSLDMQNESAVVAFALQGGLEVKILEPQWLIDKVKTISQGILEKYN